MERLIVDISGTSYTLSKYFNKEQVSLEEILGALEEMIDAKEHAEEELEDFKRNLEENFKPIPISEQVGISDRDFY